MHSKMQGRGEVVQSSSCFFFFVPKELLITGCNIQIARTHAPKSR